MGILAVRSEDERKKVRLFPLKPTEPDYSTAMACSDLCWQCPRFARSMALDAFHPHIDSGRSSLDNEYIQLNFLTASAKASRNSNSPCSLVESGRFPKLQQRHSIKRLALFLSSQLLPLRLSNQFWSSLFRLCFPKSRTCETNRINDEALYTCYFAWRCGIIVGTEAQLGPYCRSKVDQAVYRPRRLEGLVSQLLSCRIPLMSLRQTSGSLASFPTAFAVAISCVDSRA